MPAAGRRAQRHALPGARRYTTGGPGFLHDADARPLPGARASSPTSSRAPATTSSRPASTSSTLTYDHIKAYSGGDASTARRTSGTRFDDYRSYGFLQRPGRSPSLAQQGPHADQVDHGRRLHPGQLEHHRQGHAQRRRPLRRAVPLRRRRRPSGSACPTSGRRASASSTTPRSRAASKIFGNYARYYESVPLDIADRSLRRAGSRRVTRRGATSRACRSGSDPDGTSAGGPCQIRRYAGDPISSRHDPNQNWSHARRAARPRSIPTSSRSRRTRSWSAASTRSSRTAASARQLHAALDEPRHRGHEPRRGDRRTSSATRATASPATSPRPSATTTRSRSTSRRLRRQLARAGELHRLATCAATTPASSARRRSSSTRTSTRTSTSSRCSPTATVRSPATAPTRSRSSAPRTAASTRQNHVTTGLGFRATLGRAEQLPSARTPSTARTRSSSCRAVRRARRSRLPWNFSADLQLGYQYRIDKDKTVTVTLDIFNLFNFQAEIQRDNRYTIANVLPVVDGKPADIPANQATPCHATDRRQCRRHVQTAQRRRLDLRCEHRERQLRPPHPVPAAAGLPLRPPHDVLMGWRRNALEST